MKETIHRSATSRGTMTEFESCLFEGSPDPCTIVIVGASGDLTARKIVPALFSLFINGGLPDPCRIVGCARTELTQDEFRNMMRDALIRCDRFDQARWEVFAAMLHYCPVDYGDLGTFEKLATFLQNMDRSAGTGGNRVFYFAIPPGVYEKTAQMIGKAGLASEGEKGAGWSRLVVEKPFGRDLESAVALDRAIHRYFREHQIFRIDHYLAKETVQNILMFRFANSIFEPVWNREHIDHVTITAAETVGVEHRAGFYEQAGVLRDMFQNHMMQLLSLTAMDPPSVFEADRVRDEKIRVYRSLRPFPVESLDDYLVLGQYAGGRVEGKEVPAYRYEQGVAPDSLIPTFAGMKVFLDNWRWQGVPFYLVSGKRLAQKMTRIVIQFKEIPHSMFRQSLGEEVTPNRLVLGIYPDEEISLAFETKNPGAKVCLRTVDMSFHYHEDYTGPVLEAYEKVLLDCMLGDQMLFWRQDGVELCWSFLTPIIRECETCGDMSARIHFYESGSRGPRAMEKLLKDH
jgi:glucose-6-phosphate 1-dehydrogenase